MFRLPLVIYVVLITIPFLGSYAPELYAGPCEESCKTDCQGITGQERGVCIRQCLGGRCDNHGVQTAAQMLGTPGLDCSADGQCNAYCEATPDPDCVYFPPGHVGYAVKIYFNGVIIEFLGSEFFASGQGTVSQSADGTVTLTSPEDCTVDPFSVERICGAHSKRVVPQPVNAGATIDFDVVQIEAGSGNPHRALCTIVSVATGSALHQLYIAPAVLGHNPYALTADEMYGVILQCTVQTLYQY